MALFHDFSIIVSEVHYKLYALLNAEEAYGRILKIILSEHTHMLNGMARLELRAPTPAAIPP